MARTIETTTLDSKTTGTRRILGVDWPVSDLLQRVQEPLRSRPYWLITRGLCNGTADSTECYPTLREAREAF